VPYTLPREEKVSPLYAVAPGEPLPSSVEVALRQEYKVEQGITNLRSKVSSSSFSGRDQLSPAALALLKYSTTVLRATFKLRDTCRADSPQPKLNCMISSILRIGNLSAGI